MRSNLNEGRRTHVHLHAGCFAPARDPGPRGGPGGHQVAARVRRPADADLRPSGGTGGPGHTDRLPAPGVLGGPVVVVAVDNAATAAGMGEASVSPPHPSLRGL